MYIYANIEKATSENPLAAGATTNWEVKLIEADERRSFATNFFTDETWDAAPTVEDVLTFMLKDAASIEGLASFEAWATKNDRNLDSKTEERTFSTLQRDSRRLRKFLGEAEFNRAVKDVDGYITNVLANVVHAGPRPKGRPSIAKNVEEAINAPKGAVAKTSGEKAAKRAQPAASPGIDMNAIKKMIEETVSKAVSSATKAAANSNKVGTNTRSANAATPQKKRGSGAKAAAATKPATPRKPRAKAQKASKTANTIVHTKQ